MGALSGELHGGANAQVMQMLLEIGESFARARGSFGQVISREDRQTLLLLAASVVAGCGRLQ